MHCTTGIYLKVRRDTTLIGMSRPPVHAHFKQAASTLLLLLSLSLLVGCQGVSVSGSPGPTGSLSFNNGNPSVSFGNVPVGSSKTLTVTATNTETQTVTISSAAISTKNFVLTSPALPVTVAAGQSVNVSVKFSPTSVATYSATASVSSDATDPQASLSLVGTGTPSGQLAVDPASEDFGSVVVGNQQSRTVTLTNTGAGSTTISQVSAGGPGFQVSGITTPLTLSSSQSTTFTVTFAPQTTGSASGTVTIASDAANSTLTLPLAGTGTAAGGLGSNPTSLGFGNVQLGNSKTLSETVTNTGSTTVTISAVGISGAGMSVSGITAPVNLNAGQSATFSVTFAPSSAGAVSGNVTITSNASNPTLNIPVSGTGVTPGTLGANPTSLSFGNVQVGSNKTLSETVTNTGGTSVTISAIGITGTGMSVTGITAPLALAAGQSATFNVVFAPTSAGTVSGNVTITSNASNPTLSIAVSGTGFTPGTLGANPTSLSFGSVVVGSNKALSETVTNTGGSSLTISAVTASGTGFSVSGITAPVTLNAGQSATFSVTFAPTSAGAVSGSITLTSDASNPTLNIPLSGTGVTPGTLGANPTSLSFGSVVIGNSKTLSETVTNTGGSSLTISAVSASGTGFSVSGITAPITLNAGQSATFSVSFAPASAGAVSGNVALTSNGSNPTLNIPLSGTGVTPGDLAANPTSLSFGNVQVGNTSTLSETVTNTGGSSVTISAVSASGAGFSVSGISLPITLNAGKSTTFSVSFAPTAAGAVSGNVTVTSTASNPTLNIPLAGTGVAPGTLGANPTSLSFGNVQVGNSKTLSETVTNTGGSSVTISAASVSGTGMSLSGITAPVTLGAGQSAAFSVIFAPTSGGAVSGNVTITSDASNPTLNIPVSGTGVTPGTLGANPASLTFGSVQVGNSKTLSETVTNTGGSSLTISAVSASGTGFSVTGITPPVTLTSGQSATFSVTFAPTSAGAVSGNVAVTSNGSNPTLNIPLSGTGTSAPGQLSVSPTTLALGSVIVGLSGTASGTLTASGSAVTVSAASTNNSVFSVGGLSLPVTIPAGNSVPFTVTFSPQVTGAVTATLTFTSDASPSTTTETLTGTGLPAPVHTVALSWTGSTSSNIQGYNIYRAGYSNNACGKFATINSGLDATTVFTDNNVVDGSAYCYATTAVNTSNQESGYSNIVTNVQIPPP